MNHNISHGFENIRFQGEFRDYQARVLNNAEKYLDDGKLNIVAAPGSGKTVLGLELIRRIGKPCLIFSPTTAIREQWGTRFNDLFLDNHDDFENLFSTSLRDIKLVNSLTYQALFSSMSKKDNTAGSEDDSFSDIDIISEIRNHNIGTICLDEAHHLKNEWQKALEKLLALVGTDVKIIALTATPPYDADSAEWKRYLDMCGEVDEEIFVPELVASDTLCPHQDYIFFNYPTISESQVLNTYRNNVNEALMEARNLSIWDNLANEVNEESDYDKLFTSAPEYIALMILLQHYGFELNTNLVHTMVGKHGLPAFRLEFAEKAFNFIIEDDLIDDEQKSFITEIFKRHSLYSRAKVQLAMSDKLKRSLISSVGKLDSISKIAESEYDVLGDNLRMLVLTDYIKKESLSKMTTADEFHEISIVSIFETLRRTSDNVNIGVLSGTLVILPNSVLEKDTLAALRFSHNEIAGTRYSVVNSADNPHIVLKAVSELFENGDIQILIGTKSLLGEGWDAPCINSLIMASFVGSYVQSNQMRGRAIRIDRTKPDKTANIWHLVTVEPGSFFEKNSFSSYDYEILKRRFDSFMGPHYDLGVIESGIERLSLIKPPYGRAGIERINSEMLELSRDRESMRDKWNGQVKCGHVRVAIESEIEKEKRLPVFNYTNVAGVTSVATIWLVIGILLYIIGLHGLGGVGLAIFALIIPGNLYGSYRVFKRIAKNFSPARSIRTLGIALYSTLVECGYISNDVSVVTSLDGDASHIGVALMNASAREQNIFNKALTELVSPIENPRYLLIGKDLLGHPNYQLSFACPSIVGKKKEHVHILSRNLEGTIGKIEPIYTRNENGRALILKCRMESYITANHSMINSKYKVRRWE